jgi:hypothetical protein
MSDVQKRYADDGCRLTDCCGAYSTFSDGGLMCRRCCEYVESGEGDGGEYLPPEAFIPVITEDCSGPNRACRKAHREGRTVHMSNSAQAHIDGRGRLVMPTYHYATVEEGTAAIRAALVDAVTVSSDEEWLRLESEGAVPFRTRPGMNHPTRR